MNGRNQFDFTALLPKFESLFHLFRGNVSSEGISSLVIICLFLILIVFLTRLFVARRQAIQAVVFFHRLVRDVSSDDLPAHRRDLQLEASRNRNWGKMWNEFDETLVVSADSKQLQNTYNAAHFFNTTSLARGIAESRLLAAVPGFLTAIGVIGTFAGLVLGLSNIDPKSVDSIAQLIGGAAIAFKTSVWGVFLSLVFNFIEKCVDSGIQSRIVALQDHIDALFPRLSPEQTLVYVHEEARKTAITLDGLSERIGARMQEAVTQVGQQIEASVMAGLQQTLQPALESLVRAANDLADRQARGSAEVLESLIQQFNSGIKGQGEQQRAMMEETTVSVTGAIRQWSDSMAVFLAQIENQNKYLDEKEKVRSETVAQHLQASQTVVEQGQILHQQMESVMQGVQASAAEFRAGTEFLNSAASGLGTLADRLQTGINQLDNTLGRVLEQTRTLSEENTTTGRNINEVLNVLIELRSTFNTSAATIAEASEAAREQTNELTQHQQQLFSALQEHVGQLQQQIAYLLNDYTNQVQSQTQDRLNEWNEQTLHFAHTMRSAVDAIASVVEEIEDKLERRG